MEKKKCGEICENQQIGCGLVKWCIKGVDAWLFFFISWK